jgi:Pancreatitis induced protein 49 C terminal.
MFGRDTHKLFLSKLPEISKSLFGMQISEMTLEQLRNSWYLVGQDELVVMAIHQNMESFPKLLGTCGPVYAMERIRPYSDFFPEIRPSMTWERRVRIAKNFITLLWEFEKSGVGPLYHCDMQEANFGLTRDFMVKAIDVDLIYSTDRMDEILPQAECSTNEECDFFDCNSKCDLTAKKCTTQPITNNFMVRILLVFNN